MRNQPRWSVRPTHIHTLTHGAVAATAITLTMRLYAGERSPLVPRRHRHRRCHVTSGEFVFPLGCELFDHAMDCPTARRCRCRAPRNGLGELIGV